MVNKLYDKPEAIIYEVVAETGIAGSVFGVEGAAGSDLETDDTELNW